ncbi:MAG TPA: KpsF/GutQ family sugar-phosphate isomerase [Candidatus Omnitrophota bacterium]|nr:KpsF/GutQ family sugar-phosphate isomerase [Candidatus Omnitrophota bacterium]HPS19845.1 KpsF/GutQ family sugar-phosphate isomerase [Candidatus Omnitrophota bacterium]
MSFSSAKKVLMNEGKAILKIAEKMDKDFDRMIALLSGTKGRVVVTGMGKPGFIAQKVSATLSSTGTPSLYLHPAEALHGDLGRVTRDDVIIAFSNSGETEEIVRLLPIIKKIGARIISITGNKKSTLAKNSDFVIDSAVDREACPLNLAPTTSTTVMLAIGDAISVALLEKKNFQPKDFALFHPGGALGKRLLLRAGDIMRPLAKTAVVSSDELVKDVLLKITKVRAGSASIVDKKGKLIGIFTDGDLRRHFEKGEKLLGLTVGVVMTKGPCTIMADKLAADAFDMLRNKKIDEIPVVDEKGKLVGVLDVQDILNEGLV